MKYDAFRRQSSADPGLGIVVAVLTASVGTVGANSLALGPLAPALAVSYESNVVTVMHAAAAYGLGTALGALGLSPLIDMFGTSRSLLCALICIAFAFACSALAPDVGWFIAAQAFAGLAAGLALPASYAFAAQVAPAGRESEILGRVLVGWTLSLVVGVSLSALVADLIDWRWVYGTFALLTLLVLIFLIQIRTALPDLANDPGRNNTVAVKRSARITWPHATLRLPGVGPLLVICFGYMIAFYGVYGYMGSHMSNDLGMSISANGLISLCYGTGFGIAVFGDRIIDRHGVPALMPWALFLLAITYGLIAIGAASVYMLLGVCIIWGFMNHFGLNLIVAGLSSISCQKRGAILGAYSAITYMAASAGALIFGALYAASGFPSLAWTASGIMVLVLTGNYLNRKWQCY